MDKTKAGGSSKSRRSAGASEDGGGQVAHTLTACVRCRHRKTRCDPLLPRCTPCKKNNAVCEYFDAAKQKRMPRSYVVHLQDRVKQLEHELANLTTVAPQAKHNIDSIGRGASVKIKEGDEYPRFLGPASGIAMTRLVLEMARDLWDAKSIREIITEQKAQELKEKYQNESAKPTSKVYPLISFVAAPGLPSQDLTEQLVRNYNLKAQYLYPVLHEPTFEKVVANVYNGSDDPYENFAVRLVIAISMQKLDTTYAGLADSYYLAALPFLDRVLVRKNLGTLQCLLLIALYSMTTPTRTAAYWVVGLASKLSQELGMVDEATIGLDHHGQALDPLEVDLRRRCYWICLSFELGLAHILGRPSSIAISYDHPDVKPFLLVDDKHISREGVSPDVPLVMKKQISAHFMKMRLLQLEIRHTLYTKNRPTPADNNDPWFADMERKLHTWMNSSPRNDEGSGMSETWFKVRWNTIIVFLFRPSPQVPEPSIEAAERCFDACTFNIRVQKEQILSKSIDITWIFGQSLFMAINTILWTLSYPSIREKHPRSEVHHTLQVALETIWLVSQKWPGVESALDLYKTLAATCLIAYERDMKPPIPIADGSYISHQQYHHQQSQQPQQQQQTHHHHPQQQQQTNQHHSQQQPLIHSQTQSTQHSSVGEQLQLSPSHVMASPPLDTRSVSSHSSTISSQTVPNGAIDIPLRSREITPAFMNSPTSSIGSLQYTQVQGRYPTSVPYQSQQPHRLMNEMQAHSRYSTSLDATSPAIPTPALSASAYSATPSSATTMQFSPGIYNNPLPAALQYGLPSAAIDSMMDRNVFYGSLGDPYAQLLHAEYFDPGQLEGLTLEQQSELLGNLEANGLNGEARFLHGAPNGQMPNSPV